jgi:hypothetical protein
MYGISFASLQHLDLTLSRRPVASNWLTGARPNIGPKFLEYEAFRRFNPAQSPQSLPA